MTTIDVNVRTLVTDAITSVTAYPASKLRDDAGLEDDLGIDSLLLESVIDAIKGPCGAPRDPIDRTVTTVGGLIAETARAYRVPISEPPTSLLDLNAPTDPIVSTENERPSASLLTMKDFGPDGSPDPFAKTVRFAAHRREREEQHLYWYGMASTGRPHGTSRIRDRLTGQDREYLLFASNDYLGLAGDARVAEAIAGAARSHGATNTGCRIIGGTTDLHLELERRVAEFKGRQSCILFPGGYSANVGTISALLGSGDAVVTDKFDHMSITDGARLSGARRMTFAHNDVASLEERLKESREGSGGTLVVIDGVYSMHGDICPLPEIVTLAREYGARVLVDDAHATGVIGATGAGTAEHFGLKGEVDLELGTMSKALAGMGGFVVGDEEVIDYLRYYAHSYVFAATIPAPVVAGLIASLDILISEPERRMQLWSNITRLRDALVNAGLDVERTESAIIPVVVGDEELTMRLGRAVRERGLFCQTVVYPGVALGSGRLRLSVTSSHDNAQLDAAAAIIAASAREVGLSHREPS